MKKKKYAQSAKISTPERKRGAQPGNANALKHGFYSDRFRAADLSDLEICDFHGLKDEITLLRVYLRRVTELSDQVASLPEAISILRVICLASTSLTRLVKTHTFLAKASTQDEISSALRQAIEEIGQELSGLPQD